MPTLINLACGPVFLREPTWINLDYCSEDKNVLQANLLNKLPIPNHTAELVYCSHFLEHIPRDQVDAFLQECFRILAPQGTLRLVLPDFEEMCSEYLRQRASNNNEKAKFLVIEIIDQCVRRVPGGELGRAYNRYASNPSEYQEMRQFLYERNGEDLSSYSPTQSQPVRREIRRTNWRRLPSELKARLSPQLLKRRLERAWFNWLLSKLPKAFVNQNVSLATIGELHQWLWDFAQLKECLARCGFTEIKRVSFDSSNFPDFPFFPLDMDSNGGPRKGKESMYVEATRPQQAD